MSESSHKKLRVVETDQPPNMEIDKVIEEAEAIGNDDKSEEKMAHLLKNLSHMVKNFKMKAFLLEAEQEALLSMLHSLRDVESFNVGSPDGTATDLIDNLTSNLANVDVKISTDRSKNEEEALHQANSLINQLVSKVQDDLSSTREICESFLKFFYTSDKVATGGTDVSNNFESVIARCSEDDQQRIKRRLRGLLNYIKSLQSQIEECSFQEM